VGTGRLLIDGEVVVENTKNQKQGSAFFGKATVEERGEKELRDDQTSKLFLSSVLHPPLILTLVETCHSLQADSASALVAVSARNN
jgi:hypothetical protein